MSSIILVFICLLLLQNSLQRGSKCSVSMNCNDVDVLWINLDRSVERKHFMIHHLSYFGVFNNRVRAITPSQLIIPKGLELPGDCETTANLPEFEVSRTANKSENRRKVVIQTHCGRKRNTEKELTVTISHLFAIRKAIYESSSAKYALILEDDLQFAVGFNLSHLVSHAPTDFGVLQLVTSNEYSVLNLWKVYHRHKTLWVKRNHKDDYWCAGAYIINKAVMKPLIDGILRQVNEGWFVAHVIAGYEGPCYPKYCCNGSKLKLTSPCVRAPRGYQADHFIFQLAIESTYMLTIPLVTGAVYGNRSNLHQDHVHYHVSAFNRINQYMGELLDEGPDGFYGKGLLHDALFYRDCRYNASSDSELQHSLQVLQYQNRHIDALRRAGGGGDVAADVSSRRQL